MHHHFNNWPGRDTDHALEKESHLLRVVLCFYAASVVRKCIWSKATLGSRLENNFIVISLDLQLFVLDTQVKKGEMGNPKKSCG